MTHWKQQKRESNGRFLSFDGTQGKKYTAKDIEKAFMAGQNDKSFLTTPRQKLVKYFEMNHIK